ncbi:MAG: hypothetical protein A2V92_05640 [Candidatus Muproteobacteria bacterium RBG_16_65_31]|uniref:cytochrome-c oxidase n=1 Tax=Candidatus Muproteobacteria bacterium RBG_16_65_31 TaxID=1817759 RepID=A0A1F6TJ72_9PROT|nr:MAG: hypothetical protein A2V92_05640 [Candidatus Muproteobacteria bacterium RBG_16_65_31]
MASADHYSPPDTSPWPLGAAAGLFVLALGAGLAANGVGPGKWLALAGAAVTAFTVARWFGRVIAEGERGGYSQVVDRSFRWGMAGLLFAEAVLFTALLGALFYLRQLVLPVLGGGDLWSGFSADWPTAGPRGPEAAAPDSIPGPGQFSPIGAWGIPAINTMILFISAGAVVWAYWGLIRDNRAQLITGLFLTIALGAVFLALQVYDYARAYAELNLRPATGVYGATFFVLTGLHAVYALAGVGALIVLLGRALKGHFLPDRHFGLEAGVWQWLFVSAAWALLFVFVYWL